MQYTRNNILLLINKSSNQLCRINLAGAHSHKLMALIREILIHQLFCISNNANSGNAIYTKMRTDHQRLRISITDTADTAGTRKNSKLFLKLSTEWSLIYRMNLTLEALILIKYNHASASCTKMRMIIQSKENIFYTILLGNYSKKAAHLRLLLPKSTAPKKR